MSYVYRKIKIKGVDCICLSLNFLNAALGSPNDKRCIQQMESAIGNQVQLTPYKTRQRFLSPDSDEDHFKVTCLFITIKREYLSCNHTTCACGVRIGHRKLSRTARFSLYVRLISSVFMANDYVCQSQLDV